MVSKKIKNNKFVYFAILTVALFVGLYLINSNRYYLQSSGKSTYKIDRWTGKTWIVTPYGEKEVQQVAEKEKAVPFPVNNLIVGDISAESGDYCVKISGTITNNHNLPATNLMLRANFSSEQNGKPFHYEVFAPFDNIDEQIQPGSTKSFGKCMNYNTKAALDNIKWWFSVAPYSAVVFK